VVGTVVGTAVAIVGGVVGGTVVATVVVGPDGVVVHPAARSSPKSAQQTRIIPILIFMRYYKRPDYKRFLENERFISSKGIGRFISPCFV
jgi:hypothetical protein